MRLILWVCLLLAISVSDPRPAHASDVYLHEVPEVIVPVGIRPWEGTAAEVRRIERAPVPSSFRKRCDHSGPYIFEVSNSCARWLLMWHFNYGTARSAERALEYIADKSTSEIGDLSQIGARHSELSKAGLEEAQEYLRDENLSYDELRQERRVITEGRYPVLVELNSLGTKMQRIADIAVLYSDAADFYRSPRLLVEAERWQGIVDMSPPDGNWSEESDSRRLLLALADYHQPPLQELALATARASALGTEESILHAQQVSGRLFDLSFRARQFRDARLQRVAERYRYLRFRLELMGEKHGLDLTRQDGIYLGDYDFRDIEDILRPKERELDFIFSTRHEFAQAIIAQGERDVLVARAQACVEPRDREDGLAILFNGGRIVSSAHSPAVHKKIAELYLQLYASLEQCVDEDGTPFFERFPQYEFQRRLYRSYIDHYDETFRGR